MTKVKLTYFKSSGKYYTTGEYDTTFKFVWDIDAEIKSMPARPGLSTYGKEFIALVEPEDGVPFLMREAV